MHDKEISYFVNGIKYAKDEFYLDAIKEFNILIQLFPDSELVDDALYNIGLCYFEMLQFDKAIQTFFKVIDDYPESTISILDGGNEFGKTAAKSHFSIMNCYLALGELEKAKKHIQDLNSFNDSYKLINDKKFSFFDLAKEAFNKYVSLKK